MAVHKKILINMILAVFLLLAVSSAVKGNAYIIDVPYGSTPTIDGTVNVSQEWNDAYPFLISPIDTSPSAEVYVKQDGESLYFGLVVYDYPSRDSDLVGLFIDVEDDGGSSPEMDDICFGVFRNGVPFELRDEEEFPSFTIEGWSVAVQELDEYGWMVEYDITFPKIEIEAGTQNTLGILIELYDADTYAENSWPPEASEAPSSWGDLTSGDNWIPEFPSAMILPLFMVLTTLAIVFAKRRFPRKPET